MTNEEIQQNIANLANTINALTHKMMFVMTTVRVGQPSPIVGAPPTVKTLLDLYGEALEAKRNAG